MLAWLEALTPKQAQLMIEIKSRLEKIGWKTIITTRKHDYTLGIFRLKKVKPVAIGVYGGASSKGKLYASLYRSKKLLDLISKLDEKPKVHISLSSPDAVRVAFGLGIPIILLNDTPHSIFVNRLTLPLADKILIPKAIPKEAFTYAAPPNRLIQYEGVDEVSWIKKLKPKASVLRKLGLSRRDEIVVIRSEEVKASYYPKLMETPTIKVLSEIYGRNELKIVYFARYPDQKKLISERFPRVIIPKRAVDAPSLIAFSRLVVTGGGTMAREGALLGIPSISLFPAKLHVNEWLSAKGFPLWHFRRVEDAVEMMDKILDEPNKFRVNTSRMLMELEDPVEVLLKILGR
ncbi:MAG: DUF354 domain-containing protein [archaeon GB-1867-035]|nr:DUF354 domain-containing protein [Candidatus Culexmicrobium profundum]